MNQQSDSGYRYSVPDIIKDRIEISDVFIEDNEAALSYRINLSFPELHLYRTIRSREVSLLPAKVETKLKLWEEKYLRHLQFQTDRVRATAVDRLNRDAQERLAALNSMLTDQTHYPPQADWRLLERRGVFDITPEELYGIPDIPAYILTDAEGRPADVKRLDQASRPDLEKTQSQFGPMTKLFRPGKVQDAVEQEMQDWSKRRSEIGVANAERRATLRQAQEIYDASRSMFEAARATGMEIIERLQNDYADAIEGGFESAVNPAAIEEHCDLVMLAREYPDEICNNWLLSFDADTQTLHLQLDVPTLLQLNKPKVWVYSASTREVDEQYYPDDELAELCDSVAYQMVIRTMLDLAAADEANAIETINCNAAVAVQNPGSQDVSSYIVMSVSANKRDLLKLDIRNKPAHRLFEQLGGVAAGAPHLVMPVEPVT